jgi:glycerophosphoryl diester phosphodiesterase
MKRQLASRILAHRGHWSDEYDYERLEKNSLQAITRAAQLGFGIETDIRDYCGQVVISHDPSLNNEVKFREVVGLQISGLVALNVKADGLAPLIISDIKRGMPEFEYFFFDMSFPESMRYRMKKLPVADRKSEFEQISRYDRKYIWLDSFNSDWYLHEILLPHKPDDVKVVVVSPELHNRPHLHTWKWLAKQMLIDESLHICTDYPLHFLDLLESS